MNPNEKNVQQNPLAVENINRLILKFSVPAIVSLLVSALYNIVDQIFIGQGVGILGNAATNVAFPLTTISMSIALLIGVGTASNFNLELGRGNKEKAGYIAGNGVTLMLLCGVILAAIVLLFLEPLMKGFGATEQVLPYALTYTGITCFGLPFFILTTGGCHIIRADGSPTYAMVCMLSGAIINTILDPLFIFGLDMGIAGGALATIIGQIISATLVLLYFRKFKTLRLTRSHMTPTLENARQIAGLGTAACFNQLAMTIVQIVMNNSLTYYGSRSSYGSEIPLACVGIITKVSVMYMAFVIGTSQGCQPIVGFNYGSGNYDRVKKTYVTAAKMVTCISVVAFLCFQFLPRQIVSLFGEGSEEYFAFAARYFRIYMFFTFLNGLQPLTSNFFTSIGNAKRGLFIAMTRQILFLLPLIVLFPIFLGIDGIMYAGPIADGVAAFVSILFITREFKQMGKTVPA